MDDGGPPPLPQYQAAPREAPQDPPTPPDWPDSSDEARSRKRRRSRSPPARHTCPQCPQSPHRHRASTTHSGRSCSPRRHHDRPGPRSRRSHSPGHHHERYRRPLSTSPSPLRLYTTPTPSPRHHRSCSPRHRQARHCRPTSTSPSLHRPRRAPSSPRPWKAVSCFFFFHHTCRTLCRFLLPSPIDKACACLWVGRGWGCIPCLSFVLSPSSCILRPCVRLCFRPLGAFPRIFNILVRHTSIPLFPRGTWPFPIARACVCLRAGRCGVSYLVFPCSCLRLLAPCGLVYVCACVRGPSLWRPPSHC